MSGPDEIDLGVVVVTYNSAALLAELVASLDVGLAGLRRRLVVVDNGSRDGTVPTARRLAPGADVVETGHNGGYAAGINAGLARLGDCPAVLVLNPDVRLAPGCGAELLRGLAVPGTGIAVPQLVDGDGVLIDSLRREPTVLRALGDALLGARRAGRNPLLGEVVTDARHYAAETVTDWAEGSTLMISRECLRRCGSWDESYFLYSEETDFALRARDAGLVTRYLPAARAVHLEGDSGTSPALWTLLVLNRVRLFRRRHGRPATAAYWAALVLREGLRAVKGMPTSRRAVRGLLSPRRLRERPGPQMLRP